MKKAYDAGCNFFDKADSCNGGLPDALGNALGCFPLPDMKGGGFCRASQPLSAASDRTLHNSRQKTEVSW